MRRSGQIPGAGLKDLCSRVKAGLHDTTASLQRGDADVI